MQSFWLINQSSCPNARPPFNHKELVAHFSGYFNIYQASVLNEALLGFLSSRKTRCVLDVCGRYHVQSGTLCEIQVVFTLLMIRIYFLPLAQEVITE